MKRSVVRFSIALLAVALLTLCMLPVASRNMIPAVRPVNAGEDNALKFVSFLERDGFIVREGAMGFLPIDALCCPEDSEVPCSYFNVASRYMLPYVPHLDGETWPDYTCYPGDPEKNLPPTCDWNMLWHLRPDEAIILVGMTPPPVHYFGLQSYRNFTYNPEMDPTLPCPPNCYPYQQIWVNFGDQTNQLTIHTAGTPNGAPGDPFRKLTVYIVTADQAVDARVRDAARRAGYPPPIINTEPVPDSLLNLGSDYTADSFNLLFRAAIAVDQKDVQELLDYKAHPPIRVFRVTPKTDPPLEAADPFPIPEFRAHGTGTTEYYLLPAVEELRQAILGEYAAYDAEHRCEFNSDQGPCHFGLQDLANKVNTLGPSIDSLYLETTEDLGTLGPDDFFIVYGVNHEATGKAMYMNITMYGRTKQIANGSVDSSGWPSPDGTLPHLLAGSAARFLPNNPYADKLYAYKFARDCGNEEYCFEVCTGCPGMELDETAYIAWRNYLEAATKTGADRAEIVLDRAIKFSSVQEQLPCQP